MVNIVIDGVSIEANEGEYILEVARKNDIFIPAICYLSKCSPTLACKMCMVEIDGKRAYACNAKVKEGINVITSNAEIARERKAIMQSYAVNHPLECGVCDKSGECELQDFVHFCGIDTQEFFVAPNDKKMDSWGSVKYDPNLCILCERCVTTCKDNLGEANLKMIKQDFNQPDSKFKETMPKDAFSVWNRAQKGVIGFVGENACIDCAECASVCPVGALGVKSFQYTSNAWELDKISSTCNLCPSGCKIVYEAKKDMKGRRKIYRVTNDFNFNTICAGGRFAYDIYSDLSSDFSALKTALDTADSIFVGGNTTNNEARFLSALREKYNLKLINEEVRRYGEFMEILARKDLAQLSDISTSKVIISLGIALKYANPLVRYKINNALKMQKDAKFIYAHPLRDTFMEGLSKNASFLKYAPKSEYALILAILKILDLENPIFDSLEKKMIEVESSEVIADENGEKREVKKKIQQEYYEIFESAGIFYEDFKNLESTLSGQKPLLILGDVFLNEDFIEIANVLLSEKIEILVIPPSANANGILKYINFDVEENVKHKIGWREEGDFRIDSADCDFEIPYFNAIEDSMINLDLRHLPINSFDKPSDYLEILSRELGLDFKLDKMYLKNDFKNDGSDERGRKLDVKDLRFESKKSESRIFESKKSQSRDFNAILQDCVAHFYPYTKFSKNFKSNIGIYVSKEHFETLSNESLLNEGDEVILENENGEVRARIFIDSNMEGEFFALSPQIKSARELFNRAKYAKCKLRRIER